LILGIVSCEKIESGGHSINSLPRRANAQFSLAVRSPMCAWRRAAENHQPDR
jgi:hypothetical protein